MKTMRAAVVHKPGGPESMILEQRPLKRAGCSSVLTHSASTVLRCLHVKIIHPAFDSPASLESRPQASSWPLQEANSTRAPVVAAVMGGMGRRFDGGYAEYTCVPAAQIQVREAEGLGWKILGALPEMVHAAWGALLSSLLLKKGLKLLARGGSSSVGLAAAAIAQQHGAFVVSTTRSEGRVKLLHYGGAHDLLTDNGSLAEEARKCNPDGFDKVLELVGATTLADSLKVTKKNGVVCTAGIVGDSWVLPEFALNAIIPSGVFLISCSSSSEVFSAEPLNRVARAIKDGTMLIAIKTWRLHQIVEAHAVMDESAAEAKMVVLID